MPPRRTEPVSRGRKMSVTSYCLNSPLPHRHKERAVVHRQGDVGDQRRHRPDGLSAGGSRSGSAGSAGMVTTLVAAHRSPSRRQKKTDPDRSSTPMTTPTNPQGLEGSWAGRTSNTIWAGRRGRPAGPACARTCARSSGGGQPAAEQVFGVEAVLDGTVASGDHSNRRPLPESLNAIGDARIDCFEHFWQTFGRKAAPLCYPPTAPSGQMQQCVHERELGGYAGSASSKDDPRTPTAGQCCRCDATGAWIARRRS